MGKNGSFPVRSEGATRAVSPKTSTDQTRLERSLTPDRKRTTNPTTAGCGDDPSVKQPESQGEPRGRTQEVFDAVKTCQGRRGETRQSKFRIARSGEPSSLAGQKPFPTSTASCLDPAAFSRRLFLRLGSFFRSQAPRNTSPRFKRPRPPSPRGFHPRLEDFRRAPRAGRRSWRLARRR